MLFDDDGKAQIQELSVKLHLHIIYQNEMLMFSLTSNYESNSPDNLAFVCEIEKEELRQYRNGILIVVEELINRYKNAQKNKTDKKIKEYHEDLTKIGYSLYKRLTRRNKGKGENTEAVEIFDVIFNSINPDYPQELQIFSTDFLVPIEFLNRTENARMEDMLGYNYIITKAYRKMSRNNFTKLKKHKLAYLLNSENKKDLQNYYENSLFNVIKEEIGEFETLNLNYKNDLLLKDIKLSFQNDSRIDFVHFEGHIRHNEKSQLHSLFDFKNIQIKFMDIYQLKELKNKVLFLNCCNSGVNDHFIPENFTYECYLNDLASIISVDIQIPKIFAREFANLFYTCVFLYKMRLDEALYLSRMYFFEADNNYCGWFYSVYGETYVNK